MSEITGSLDRKGEDHMKLMPIAILDADSQAKFLRFQKIALDRGVKMNVLNPHITMATYFLPLLLLRHL